MDRSLIIKSKWVNLILKGEKTWEMRSRPTNITGWIGLIEAGTGLIVGKAFLLCGHEKPNMNELVDNRHKHRVEDLSLLTKWGFAWKLEQAERFKKPIPYNHPKGAVIWVNTSNQLILLPKKHCV